jgi:hypothetical protein
LEGVCGSPEPAFSRSASRQACEQYVPPSAICRSQERQNSWDHSMCEAIEGDGRSACIWDGSTEHSGRGAGGRQTCSGDGADVEQGWVKNQTEEEQQPEASVEQLASTKLVETGAPGLAMLVVLSPGHQARRTANEGGRPRHAQVCPTPACISAQARACCGQG